MSLQETVPSLQHSFVPIPIYGSGQPLLSQESTSSFTGQVPIDGVGEEAVLEGQNMPVDLDSFRSRSCISRAGRYPSRLVALSIQWCRSTSSLGIEWTPPVGSGQPLFSQESTPSPTVQVPIVEDGEKAVLEGQNMPLQEIVLPLQHSFVPIPIDGSGQPLLSQESTSSFTVQVPIDGVGEEAVL